MMNEGYFSKKDSSSIKKKKEKLELQKKMELQKRPAWNFGGRMKTRSMAKSKSGNTSLNRNSLDGSRPNSSKVELKPKENKKTMKRVESASAVLQPTNDQPTDEKKLEKIDSELSTELPSTDPSMEEMEPTCQSTPRVPFKKLQTNISSGLTPNAKRLNLNQSFKDFETIQLNKELNLPHWKSVHQDHAARLTVLKTKIVMLEPPQDEFWEDNTNHIKGEVIFFLGMKSKFSQFEAMLEDPKSEKYKVKTEDDITCYWEGMVKPALDEFLARADWLVAVPEKEWSQEAKDLKPTNAPVATVKITVKPKREEDPELKAKMELAKQKRLLKKQAEDDRRKEMREMIRAKRKASKQAEEQSSAEPMTL